MTNARDLSQLATVAGTTSYSFRNKIINGDMEINQRGNASVSVTSASNFYQVDRFVATGRPSGGVFSLTQSNNAPPGFANSLFATVTTANSAFSTTAQYIIGQYIEGINTEDLDWGKTTAKPATLSFFVYSSVTGRHGGSIQNGPFNKSYLFSYTIDSANTWEQKVITIPGPTDGQWYANTSAGVRVWFNLGTSYTGTANTWIDTYLQAPTGAANVISTLGATFGITGVQFEKGATATPFEKRPYTMELLLCKRYYNREPGTLYGHWGSGSGYSTISYQHPVEMRLNPPGWTATTSSGTFTGILSATSTLTQYYYTVAGGATAPSWTDFKFNAELT